MIAPRRSPFSRSRCRSIGPSDTSAVSAPAKNAENASDNRNSNTNSVVCTLIVEFSFLNLRHWLPVGEHQRADV